MTELVRIKFHLMMRLRNKSSHVKHFSDSSERLKGNLVNSVNSVYVWGWGCCFGLDVCTLKNGVVSDGK